MMWVWVIDVLIVSLWITLLATDLQLFHAALRANELKPPQEGLDWLLYSEEMAVRRKTLGSIIWEYRQWRKQNTST